MALDDMWGNQPCMTYKTDNFIWFSLIAFPDSQHHYSKSRQLLAQSAAFLWMLTALESIWALWQSKGYFSS